MKQRVVNFSPEAALDPNRLYDLIAAAAGASTAMGYIVRLGDFCRGLDLASERGQLRDDIRKGLRIIGFERRVTVAFAVNAEAVTILRLFYGGQNWEAVV